MSDIFANLGNLIDADEEQRLRDQRPRTLIIDFNHLAFKYSHGMKVPLITQLIMPDGTSKSVVTNIQNGTSKAFNRWARGGKDRLAVCFDRPTPTKKQYIGELFGVDDSKGYKASRGGSMPNEMFEAIQMTQDLLVQAGVSCYAVPEYEADDLILACIEAAKAEYPDDPIDIVTGDLDLVPLVDDQVSVFLSSRVGTYATHKFLEKSKYEQVTPENYAKVIGAKTAMKNLSPDYNTVLLIKMLRGDTSDNIPGTDSRFFTPTRVREIAEKLGGAGIDLANTFRYGGDLDRMTTLLSSFVLVGNALDAYINAYGTHGDALNSMLFGEFGEINVGEALGIDVESVKGDGKDGMSGLMDLGHTRKTYRAMNLNETLVTKNGVERKQARVRTPVTYDEGKYIQAFSSIKINVKTY